MGRFLGGRFGNIASISPGVDAESGIYSMPDQYYSTEMVVGNVLMDYSNWWCYQ